MIKYRIAYTSDKKERIGLAVLQEDTGEIVLRLESLPIDGKIVLSEEIIDEEPPF